MNQLATIVRTIKLHIHADEDVDALFRGLTRRYSIACNDISLYVFNNGFPLNTNVIQSEMYHYIRDVHGLKSQMTISAIKTVVARYRALQTKLFDNPFRYKDEDGNWITIPRTLEWLWKPVVFSRPQADLVRGRDYSFTKGGSVISINTLDKRVHLSYDLPKCYKKYFNSEWRLGTGKLVSLKGEWYLHISASLDIPDTFDPQNPTHIVGLDRGLRFLTVSYDETGRCRFVSGQDIMKKRESFAACRAELQAKGTKSAKRRLKALSGRENRWMTDLNHQFSKTLVQTYGAGTLFAIEDLTGVSFSEEILSNRGKEQRRQLRSWAFYQFEQFLTYKAEAAGAAVLKVPAAYTSQRCPKCGRIHKENRKHDIHEYVCDTCGYRSNDDRVGAMNIYQLAVMYVAGDPAPTFAPKKKN